MKTFSTIFKFEYLSYIKSKSYIVTTAIMLIVVLLFGNFPSLMNAFDVVKDKITSGSSSDTSSEGKGESGDTVIGIIDSEGTYTDDILTAYLPGYTFVHLEDTSTVEDAVQNGDYKLVLEINGLKYKVYLRGSDIMDSSFMSSMIDTMVLKTYRDSFLHEAGLSQEDIINVESMTTQSELVSIGKDITQTFWLAYVLLMLLYMTTLMYGQYVLMSVATEKSSKAMELLITSAKPINLMFGKVLGAGAAGLTQMMLVVLGGFTSIALNTEAWTSLNPLVAMAFGMSVSVEMVIYIVVFFLLGFFSFAFIYAGVGSTVSRLEEASSAISIPMFIFIAAFLVAMIGMTAVDATWVKVFSYLPLFSPMVMFMRICVTDISMINIIIAVILNCVYVFISAWISSKIYRVGVMLYGNKVNIVSIFKMLLKS